MEETKLISFPYTVIDGETQHCSKEIVVDAAKVTVNGDFTDLTVLDEDGVLYTTKDLFVIEFNGHVYGSETMDQDAYVEAVNACCISQLLGQVITFADPADKTFGNAPFALGATASSGLTVTYTSSNPAVLSISGGNATVVGAGSAIITAHQAGNATFSPADDVPQTVNVAKAAQTITFGALSSKAAGSGAVALTATASSGLAVSYVSSAPSIASISGTNITPVAAGTANITASQAGNANYNAATPVVQPQVVT